MLRWALIFFIISVLAGFMGFSGVAAGSAALAKIFFFIALAIFLVLLIAGVTIGKAVTGK